MDEIIIPDADHFRPQPFHIPTEVCENIIDMLYSEMSIDVLKNIATLYSCALVCRDWRVRAQRTLFYRVQLTDMTSFRRLSAILDDSRHLRDYVREVQLTGYHLHNTTSIFALFPAVFAGKLPNLFWIDVTHFPESEETPFPRTPGAPKAKALSYLPLHPRFPAFLSAFTAVLVLFLTDTTFRTFGEFARMLHGLPNLRHLMGESVHWISPGGSHPGADHFMKQFEWPAGKGTLPPFAPNIREVRLLDVALYGARRLISTRGPHLCYLGLTIPLLNEPESLADGGRIDLGSSTGLRSLVIFPTSQFSVAAHGGLVSELLGSWKQLHPNSILRLLPYRADQTSRQRFAEILSGLGAILEAWLQTVDEQLPSAAGRNQDGPRQQHVQCQLHVEMYEWEVQRTWWLRHLRSCFPTWSKSGRLQLTLRTPQGTYDEWTDEELLSQLNAVRLASQVQTVDA